MAEQENAPQPVPAAAALHAPAPSQPPARHCASFAGQAASAVPAPTAVQAPAAVQDLQVAQDAPTVNVQATFVPSQLLVHAPVVQAVRVPCGLAPAGSVVQAPSWPVTSQAWQELPHVLLQQKPSIHWPEVH